MASGDDDDDGEWYPCPVGVGREDVDVVGEIVEE